MGRLLLRTMPVEVILAENAHGRGESTRVPGMGTMRAMDMVSIGTASATPPETEEETDGTAGDRGNRPSADTLASGTGIGGDHPADPPFGRGVALWLGIATAAVLAVALVLRFWTRSDLWLDEALTVNIAKQPLHTLPMYLKRDGAPPLFYVLLHGWMGVFGDSDLAVRSLSGVIGVVTVPLVWLAGRRFGGRTAGWAAMLLVATSPFAVRYGTETRMYALVALLTVLGLLAMQRVLTRPRPGNLVALAVVTGLLLYSHYWSFYLLGTAFLWLVWQAWRGRPQWRRPARLGMVAMAVGALTFIPWVPIFLYQSAHTGTPWATPANFAAMVNAVASFAGGGSNQGRVLALIYFALIGLGLFGLATDRRHIELDIRTRPLGPAAGVDRPRHPGCRHRRRVPVQQRLRCPLRVGGVRPGGAAGVHRAHHLPRPEGEELDPGRGHHRRTGRLVRQYHHQPDPGRGGGGSHEHPGATR